MNEYGRKVSKEMDSYMSDTDSVSKEIDDIQNAVEGVEVRGALAAGVKKSFDKSKDAEQRSIEQTDRVDTLIQENPQPSEVVDARLGYPTLRDKLNSVDSQLAETKSKLSRVPNEVKALASVVYDDGHILDYDLVYPYFKSKGISGSSALINSSIGNSGKLGWSEINEMKDNGWEFLGHSYTHPDLTTLSNEDLVYELKNSKEEFENMGLNIDGIVYPYNYYNNDVLEVAAKYYDYGMGHGLYKSKNINIPPINQFGIYRVTLESDPSYVQSIIDEGIENNAWIVFMAHSMYYDPNRSNYRPEGWSNVKENIQYCLDNGVNIVTVKEALKFYGNSLTIGDDVFSENKFFVSKNGVVESNSVLKSKVVDDGSITNDTPGSEFEEDALTITTSLIGDEAGFPTDAGNLLTYVFGGRYGVGHQEWIPYDRDYFFKRYWNSANDKWGEWVRFVGETVKNLGVDSRHAGPNTSIESFDLNKLTIAVYTVNYDKEGFPSEAGRLHTYNFGDKVLGHQIWYPHTGESFFIRNWKTTTRSWGEWVEIGGEHHFIIDDLNSFNGNTPLENFPPKKVTITPIDNEESQKGGLPIEAGGTLTTYRIASNGGYCYQVFREYSSNNTWTRNGKVNNSWGEWAKISFI